METNEKSSISILVAEPLALVRAGLCALLSHEPGFTLVGNTGEATDVVTLVAQLKPDVLVVDPELLGPAIATLVAEAIMKHPALSAILVLNPQRAAEAPELLASGVQGCFLKTDPPGEFLRGVRAAAAHELAISTNIARVLLGKLSEPVRRKTVDDLTEREREVLSHLTTGLSNKEIAQSLYLSVRTVEVHLRNIYAKLGVRSRLEAVTRRTDG